MKFGVPSVTVLQHRPMGMADALLSASSELQHCRLLIIIADDLLDKNILTSVAGYAKKIRYSVHFPDGKRKPISPADI